MPVISPSVTPTSTNPHEYRQQLERITPFASRVQIDLMDGVFASPESIRLGDVWLPENIETDIHLMYSNPLDSVEALIRLRPSLIIVHAEANGDLLRTIDIIKGNGIRAGVALLQDTKVETVRHLLDALDHVLIFAGSLGTFGGVADLQQLAKVQQIRSIKNNIEIGWDGGANATNVKELADAGIDVINVGAGISRSEHPAKSYEQLSHLVS